MPEVFDITIKQLENGSLEKELPELYELKDNIENGNWHKNDSTFHHTLLVLKALEKIRKTLKPSIVRVLQEKIGTHTRWQLLFLGGLFHDIAKKETLKLDGQITKCPRHAEVGAEKTKRILERFDSLGKAEKQRICDCVRFHMLIHEIIEENEEKMSELKASHAGIFLELVLLGMADTMGCQYEASNPKDYAFRVKAYEKILEKEF